MLNVTVKHVDLAFETSSEVFSPQNADRGTLAMLAEVDFQADDQVLDLGCGYGLVGILAARLIGPDHVVMTDIDPKAIALARKNAALNDVAGIRIYQSDGVANLPEKDFTLILANPPYHVDFAVPRQFIEKGFNRLVIGGKMYLVTKRKDWYKNKLLAIFGGVKIIEKDGYFVFMAEKRTLAYARKK
jgi:16S rRNA (guanine1207-N2)-methyltransferase